MPGRTDRLHRGDTVDGLARALGGATSRRQFAKLAAGTALAAMLPGSAHGARMPRAHGAKRVGSCEPQPYKDCRPGTGSLRGDWFPGCSEPVSKGDRSSFNGCGPEGGIDVTVIHDFGKHDLIPDRPLDVADFARACNGHDCCYGRCGSEKASCDANFLDDLLHACDQASGGGGLLDDIAEALCFGVAKVYYDAVSTTQTGQDAYNAGQKEVCDCCLDCQQQAQAVGYLDARWHKSCPYWDPAVGHMCVSTCANDSNCGDCGVVCAPKCDENSCQNGACYDGECRWEPGGLGWCSDCQGLENCGI
jgi:hypothetical protein